jgi:4-hydroxy-3-methylbut-2-enyl diphosphate reductase
VHGKPSHEETRATFSHSRAHTPTIVLKDLAEAECLAHYITGVLSPETFYDRFRGQYSEGFDVQRDLQRIGVVNQTTMLATETGAIADFLKETMRSHYGLTEENLSLHFADTRDTLCYATADNQGAVLGMLSQEADLALVIGGYNSSNTSHLVELCEQKLPTFYIDSEDCLLDSLVISHYDMHAGQELESADWLPQGRESLNVLITAGASSPDALVERVIHRLAFLTGNAHALEILPEYASGERQTGRA